jgi:Ribbon-helix-helix protein, copG family
VAEHELLRRAEQAELDFHPGSDLAKHFTQYKGCFCMSQYYIVRLGMVRWSIWLDEKTVAALKKIGEEEDRPVGWLIRKAVEEFIQRRKQGK